MLFTVGDPGDIASILSNVLVAIKTII